MTPVAVRTRKRWGVANRSKEAVGEVGMRSTPPSGGWRYGRVDGWPGVACTMNLVAKSATSDGDKVPAVPVGVFGEIPWQ